jgi:hypothetical protein
MDSVEGSYRTREDNDFIDLMIQIDNDLSDQYKSDRFYFRALQVFEEHGYELGEEEIFEVSDGDEIRTTRGTREFDIDGYHLELLTEFEGRDEKYTVKMVLENGDGDQPYVKFAKSLCDFSDLPLAEDI